MFRSTGKRNSRYYKLRALRLIYNDYYTGQKTIQVTIHSKPFKHLTIRMIRVAVIKSHDASFGTNNNMNPVDHA